MPSPQAWWAMNKFFNPNIGTAGRVVRALWGFGLLAISFFLFESHWIVSIGLGFFAVFAFYEAIRGWCIMRACGIKTKI
jgi:hypothetical protein